MQSEAAIAEESFIPETNIASGHVQRQQSLCYRRSVKPLNRTFLWVTIYAVAMGVLEAAVVIYLRRLYFPGGFQFPLSATETDIAIIEMWRELATLLMLIAVGAIAGRNRGERFAYFVYAFGVWDLIYYAFLKLALGWPESLLTWDILFLLPVPWVGPVLTPCILALTMMAFGSTVVRFTTDGVEVHMLPRERALLWLGAFVVIVSFTVDWVRFEGPTIWQNIALHRPLDYNVGNFVPVHFPWWIFVLGEAMILAAFAQFHVRLSARKKGTPKCQR
jgi:hypothetical protein